MLQPNCPMMSGIMKRSIGLFALLIMGCEFDRTLSQVPQPSQTVQSAPVDRSIWSQLRQVETFTVILMRHAQAPGTGDPRNFRLHDCSTQRNLSQDGRRQAKQIGQVFRQRQIPVARVLSSQWCRCLDTARLLELGKVEPLPALNSFFRDRSTETRQTEELRQFIMQNKSDRQVVVMVTHQVNITAITGTIPDQGDAVVVQLDGQNQFKTIGMLNPN
ncbi:histidine phosphatase family protein [Leptolyngbya sp. AN03gr2]|uniref:histidine phosphatase family protein n=1 Tax=unclassified Leptolyngbya TaxID=2650499 RepID=UPI003D31EECC